MSSFRWRATLGSSATLLDPPTGLPAVYVMRGELTESVHAIAACSSDESGSTLQSVGSVDVPIFIRSCAKPIIAGAVVRAGAVERFGLTLAEIAVIAGSHDGEAHHVAAVRSILNKAGMTEEALRCGAHAPRDEESASALRIADRPFSDVHNNCSGKHAGLLLLARLLSADTETYLDMDQPVQQCVLRSYERIFGKERHAIDFATDGCGAPVPAVSLRELAMAYARVATLNQLDEGDVEAFRLVRNAMITHPQYVGGTNNFDTLLMRAMEGSLVAKRGAEGVHATGSTRSGVGVAVKIIDGSLRALPVAVLGVLETVGLLKDVSDRTLGDLAPSSIRNLSGKVVGRIAFHRPAAFKPPGGCS